MCDRDGTSGRLDDFATWLRARRLARDHQIPHMVRWVERFLRLASSRPREEVWKDSLRVFLDNLHEGDMPDWQIRQAADSVSLYLGQFTPGAKHALSRSASARCGTVTAPPREDGPRRPLA